MSISKHMLFREQENEIASCCKCLSHPARLIILRLLSRGEGFMTQLQMLEHIPLAQSTVSRHLNYLLRHGILAHHIHPLHDEVGYIISRENWSRAQRILQAFLTTT